MHSPADCLECLCPEFGEQRSVGRLFKGRRSIRTVFFDVGGVVIDAPMMANFLKYGTEIFGCRDEDLHRVTAQCLPALERGELKSEEFWDSVCTAMANAGLKEVPAWRFKGFWEGILEDNLSVNQAVIDIARRVKGHATVGILSNVIHEHAKLLQKNEVYQHFNPVVLSCKVGARKPEAAVYQKAAELSKTTMDRCLLIDDDERNLTAAEKLGYRTLHFSEVDDLRMSLYKMGLLESK